MGKGKKNTLVEKRLLTYSAAAVGVLALAPAADAAVKYSGVKNLVVNSGNPSVKIDLNFDGVMDLSFFYNPTAFYGGGAAIYAFRIDNANAYNLSFIKDNNVNYDAVPLQCNYLIKGTLNNPNYYWNQARYDTLAGGWATAGNFDGKKGSIGFRFDTPTGKKYGWIRFDGTSAPTSGVIVDWAYEDSGSPIQACDIGIVPIPAPATDHVGLLILIALLAGASFKMLKKEQA